MGQVSAIIVVLYLAIALIVSLIKMLLRCRLLIPRHGFNRRTVAASLSLSDYIYGQWYKDQALFEEQAQRPNHGRGSVSAPERARMLSDSLDKHILRSGGEFGTPVFPMTAINHSQYHPAGEPMEVDDEVVPV